MLEAPLGRGGDQEQSARRSQQETSISDIADPPLYMLRNSSRELLTLPFPVLLGKLHRFRRGKMPIYFSQRGMQGMKGRRSCYETDKLKMNPAEKSRRVGWGGGAEGREGKMRNRILKKKKQFLWLRGLLGWMGNTTGTNGLDNGRARGHRTITPWE